MTANWQIERSQLNHNWLQNGVLVALSHAVSVAGGTVRSRNPRQTLMEDVCRWQEHRHHVSDLLKRFEHEMSPTVLFGRYPLCRCTDSTKRWLIPLTHKIWLEREGIGEKLAEAATACETAERAYEVVLTELQKLPGAPTSEDLSAFARVLHHFRTACETLSHSISAFPNEIRCV